MNADVRIESTLRTILSLLAAKNYSAVETLTNGVRLKAKEIEAGIVDYGKTVTLPPEEALREVDVVQIRNSGPTAYSIRFRLYTVEEGRSDLELQATFVDESDGTRMRVELDNIIVA